VGSSRPAGPGGTTLTSLLQSSGMENDFIPTTPEFITKDWLVMVINQYRRLHQQSLLRSPEDIKDMACTPHPRARGILSNSYQVTVHFTCITSMGAEKLQYNFYFKMAVQEGPGRAEAVEAALLEREVETLLGLVPRLKRLVGEQEEGEQVELAVADIIYGSYSTEGDGVVVARDLLAEGYTHPTVGPGLPLPTLVAGVEALARLHATSAVLLEREGVEQVLEQLPHLDQGYYDHGVVRDRMAELLKEFCGLVRRVPGYHTQYQRMEGWRARAANIITSTRRRRAGPPLVCLTHGNPSMDNILVREKSVVLTDWKGAVLGSPMSDLAMFLLSSTDLATRTDHLYQLLDTYNFAFCRAVQRLGLEPAATWPAFSPAALRTEFDRCLFGAFLQVAAHLMEQLQALEAAFRRQPTEEAGLALRQVGRRAVELVEEACGGAWKAMPKGCVESEASITLILPPPKNSIF